MTHKECKRIASPQPPFPPLLAPRQPQEPAWQRSPSQLCPPPDFLQNFQFGEGVCGLQANDLPFPPRPPSPILPVLNAGRHCPLALEEIRRGANLRKVKKQTCDLDANTARQALLKQIQQGVNLKPVSPDVVFRYRNSWEEIVIFLNIYFQRSGVFIDVTSKSLSKSK